MMINISEYTFDKDGREMCRVLEDKNIKDSKIYAKIFPELYAEIKSQYDNSENHFYYLSEKAHLQYQQKKYGLLHSAEKDGDANA